LEGVKIPEILARRGRRGIEGGVKIPEILARSAGHIPGRAERRRNRRGLEMPGRGWRNRKRLEGVKIPGILGEGKKYRRFRHGVPGTYGRGLKGPGMGQRAGNRSEGRE